jgi:tetratricopeptide (TPR) repeat protein
MEDNDSQNQHDLRSFSQPIALPVKVHKQQPTPTPFVTPIELQKQMDELQAQDPESPLIDNLIRDIDKAHKKLLGVDSFAYSKTEKLYQKDLELFERQIAPDHPILASSLKNLAELYRAQGKYCEAETPYLRLLKIAERRIDAYPYSIVDCLNNLALMYYSQGKYSEAEPLYLRSLEIRGQHLKSDDSSYTIAFYPSFTISLYNLAEFYRSQGIYCEAESLSIRLLEIIEELGIASPHVAIILSNLAEFYRSQDMNIEADHLYLRSQKTRG